MIDHHLWRLRNRRKELTRLLRDAETSPAPDPLLIEDLRRRKQQVTDDLALAEAGLLPGAPRTARH